MATQLTSPIHDRHVVLGAKMADFGGWDMPIEYPGVVAEHTAVRERVGIFDVSHLGKARVSGRAWTSSTPASPTTWAGSRRARAIHDVLHRNRWVVDDLIQYLRAMTTSSSSQCGQHDQGRGVAHGRRAGGHHRREPPPRLRRHRRPGTKPTRCSRPWACRSTMSTCRSSRSTGKACRSSSVARGTRANVAMRSSRPGMLRARCGTRSWPRSARRVCRVVSVRATPADRDGLPTAWQ